MENHICAGLSGKWDKIVALTTPPPLPVNIAMGLGWAGRKTWESVKGLEVRMSREWRVSQWLH